MPTPPRRPGRPGRPGAGRPARPAAPARRRPPAEEPLEGEEDELDEPPPPPAGPNVAMIIGLVAALAIAILIAIVTLGGRGYLIEVENMSENPLGRVVVKVNGVAHDIGDLRPNEIAGSRATRTPGGDVEVEYVVPNRGKFTKHLPKKSIDGGDPAPDFADFTGRIRIRLLPEGIQETEY